MAAADSPAPATNKSAAPAIAPASAPGSAGGYISSSPAAPASAGIQTHGLRQNDGELLQLVSFMVGTEEFAVPILAVQEINRMLQITKVPQSPPFIEGVINLRGKIIPVMDLRKRFGLSQSNESTDSRIIVVEVGSRVIGFTVDRVNEVLRISGDIVEPPPAMVCSLDSDYVQGVGKLEDRLLILLNLERLFSADDLQRIQEITAAA
ncbi:MAG: chemotaxis protein CheW [Phycisphaeraceae bacterium]|nr:chemotaxis protein CheW [Phycisphaeraceae bacterium]